MNLSKLLDTVKDREPEGGRPQDHGDRHNPATEQQAAE